MGVYKFTMEFTVRAESKEEAERLVKLDIGEETHTKTVSEEIEDTKQKVDVDYTTEE